MNWFALVRLSVRFLLVRFLFGNALIAIAAVVASLFTHNLLLACFFAVWFFTAFDILRNGIGDDITPAMLHDLVAIYGMFPGFTRYKVLCEVFETLTLVQFKRMAHDLRGTPFEYDITRYLNETFPHDGSS